MRHFLPEQYSHLGVETWLEERVTMIVVLVVVRLPFLDIARPVPTQLGRVVASESGRKLDDSKPEE